MADTGRDDVYTGPTIEEDICEETRRLGWELVVACLDSVLGMTVATMLIWLYCSLVAEWIDVFGKILVGIGHIRMLLPLLSITLFAWATSRLYVAMCLWRERRTFLS